MKKSITFILALVLLCCFGQHVKATVEETIVPDYLSSTMRWIVMTIPEEMDSYLDTLYVSKDSVVNGKIYKVIAQHLFRQEGYKIYYLYPKHGQFSAQEYLIYDFNPQIGDSIVIGVPGMDQRFRKTAVVRTDIVTLLDGRAARRIAYANNSISIEYVGDVRSGFLSHISDGWVDHRNQQVYDGPTLLYDSEKLDLSILSSQQSTSTLSTKHMVNGFLLIEVNGQSYDALGRELK